MAHRRFHKGLGGGLTVLALQVLAQRAGIHTDADGDTLVARGIDNGAHTIVPTDVTWIDAQAVDLLDVAMRLTGVNKPWYPTVKACSLFVGGRVEEAASVASAASGGVLQLLEAKSR